jgi:hypothetical protein
MRTSVIASMGTTMSHRDAVRAPADPPPQANPRPERPTERREAPLATRVSVKRVMRAFKRI